jgi:hypothetical protein
VGAGRNVERERITAEVEVDKEDSIHSTMAASIFSNHTRKGLVQRGGEGIPARLA